MGNGVGGILSRELIEVGPSLGTYKGRDIHAFLRYSDGLYGKFVGIAGETEDGSIALNDVLQDGEFLVFPGLIYIQAIAGAENDDQSHQPS